MPRPAQRACTRRELPAGKRQSLTGRNGSRSDRPGIPGRRRGTWCCRRGMTRRRVCSGWRERCKSPCSSRCQAGCRAAHAQPPGRRRASGQPALRPSTGHGPAGACKHTRWRHGCWSSSSWAAWLPERSWWTLFDAGEGRGIPQEATWSLYITR